MDIHSLMICISLKEIVRGINNSYKQKLKHKIPDLLNTRNALLRENCVAMSIFIKKSNKSQINHLQVHQKLLEK
jgi:hypothetical protein